MYCCAPSSIIHLQGNNLNFSAIWQPSMTLHYFRRKYIGKINRVHFKPPHWLLTDDHTECCGILCHWKVPVHNQEFLSNMSITTCKVIQGPTSLQDKRKSRATQFCCFHELTVSCGTTPIAFRRLSRVTFRISCPSMLTCQEANFLDP